MVSFDVEVYDKDLARVGWLKAYLSVTATPRHNRQPTGALTVASDHHLVPALNAPGARVVLRTDGLTMSGPVRVDASEGAGPQEVITYQVEDDWRLLRRLLAWQVPAAAITAQSSAEYAVYTGPAETVVKAMLTANLTRMGSAMRPTVTVAADQGRGATITVQARMHAPVDRLFPLVDQAGIGVSVTQVGTGLVVDCYEPGTFPITLSYAAGTITGGSWSRTGPQVTRVVVGAGGEGTARVFRTYADAALEAEWGDVIEGFVDARDIDPADPDLETLMAARGAEALAEGAPKAGLSLDLAETGTFRYGAGGVVVGDTVTAELAPGLTVTDVIREATLTDTPSDGLVVAPVLGERSDNDTATARAVAALARTIRDRARS